MGQRTVLPISIRTKLSRAIRQTDLYWHYVANYQPWLAYSRAPASRLSETHRHLLADLRRDGIVMTTAKQLFGESPLLYELARAVQDLEVYYADEIAGRRRDTEAPGVKRYQVDLLGSCPVLNPKTIFVRFALQPAVLDLANRYMGMYTRLSFFNVWHNLPTQGEPRNAQLWHRDLDDHKIFKLFLYFTDVTERDGPLVYAPGTHTGGRVRRDPEAFREEGTTARRSNDEQMSRVVPGDKWITAVGPKGTVLLVDTSGYHKGGLVRGQDRILYTCMFTSQAAQLRRKYFERTGPVPVGLDRAVTFALGGSL